MAPDPQNEQPQPIPQQIIPLSIRHGGRGVLENDVQFFVEHGIEHLFDRFPERGNAVVFPDYYTVSPRYGDEFVQLDENDILYVRRNGQIIEVHVDLYEE